MDQPVRIILPLAGLSTRLLPIHTHFLKVFEIHLHGVIREAIRLTLQTNERIPSAQLEYHIDDTAMNAAWAKYRFDVNPRYDLVEAIAVYRAIVIHVYDGLYPLLRLAVDPMYRRLNIADIKLTNVRYLCDSMEFVLHVDWLPF